MLAGINGILNGVSSAPPVPAGLSLLHLQKGSGNIYTDLSSYANPVTPTSITSSGDAFDGDAYLKVVNTATLQNNMTQFDIEMSITPTSVDGHRGIFIKRNLDNVGAGAFGIGIRNGTLEFWNLEFSPIQHDIGCISVNQPSIIRITKSLTQINVYVNNVQTVSFSDSSNYSNIFDIYIGVWGIIGGFAEFFEGSIDYVKVWGSAV